MGGNSRIADLRWVHPVSQSRSERTREALLDAARAVVVQRGFDNAGVVEIAERAGCSPGSIYRRFRNREGLMRALFEQVLEEWEATRVDAVDPGRWEGASIVEVLDGYLRFALSGEPDAALLEATLRGGFYDQELRERVVEQFRLTRAGVAALLAARSSEISHPRPHEAIDFVLALLAAALSERRAWGPGDPYLAELSADGFVSALLEMAGGYLGLASSPPAG